MAIGNLDYLIDPDAVDETDDTKHSHIIERDPDGRDARVLVTEAYVNGTMLTALCGYKWTPSKDPETLPLCSKCKDIAKTLMQIRNL